VDYVFKIENAIVRFLKCLVEKNVGRYLSSFFSRRQFSQLTDTFAIKLLHTSCYTSNIISKLFVTD